MAKLCLSICGSMVAAIWSPFISQRRLAKPGETGRATRKACGIFLLILWLCPNVGRDPLAEDGSSFGQQNCECRNSDQVHDQLALAKGFPMSLKHALKSTSYHKHVVVTCRRVFYFKYILSFEHS